MPDKRSQVELFGDYQQCTRCGIWVEDDEWVCNFGWCDSCLEDRCPCHENNSKACPLHRYPDIVLSFGKGP